MRWPWSPKLDLIIAAQAVMQATLNTLVQQGKHIMAQNDDLAAAVSALATAATSAETAIQTELSVIASNSGNNPAVAAAISNIQAITAGLTQSAASVPTAPPAPAARPAG